MNYPILEIVGTGQEDCRELFKACFVDSEKLLIQLIRGAIHEFKETTYGYVVQRADSESRWDEAIPVFRELAKNKPEQCDRLLGPLVTALLTLE